MKSLFICIVIFTVCNSYGQPENTKTIASFEKSNFDKTKNKGLSLASNNFQVTYYRCNWNIDPSVLYISGSVTSYFITTAQTGQVIYDFTKQLTVDSVLYHGSHANFLQQTNSTLVINFPGQINVGKKDSVSVYYHGIPPSSGDFTGGFTQAMHGSRSVIWTLSEPYGAAGWWPCRNGLEDKADSMDIYITHPSQNKASSNGVLVSTVVNGKNTTTHYKHRYPIASYLVCLAVTNYTVLTDSVNIHGKTLPVIQYVYPENVSDFQAQTPTVLNALQLFSNYFGDYPFIKERYGQTQFGWGGGMEHQTNSFVAGTSTNLLTHELGHQWFGDKVTCGSWQDVWLNEGFAAWMADMFYPENFDTAIYKQNVTEDLLYVVSQPGGSVFVNDTTNSNRIFDGRLTYDKGAFLVRMLRWTMGDSLFFAGINRYLNDPKLKYGFARTEDLQRNLQKVSGMKLQYFFNQWFYGQGYPSFTVKWKDSSDHNLYFTVSQTTSMPSSVKFFKVPLPVQVNNGAKTKLLTLWVTQKKQDFIVPDPGFVTKKVEIDPDHFIISKNNKVVKLKSGAEMNKGIATLSVSPNPVFDMAQVSLQNFHGKTLIQLFNNNGNVVWSRQLNINRQMMNVQIPFSSFNSGIYSLQVRNEEGINQSINILK